ncbi:MAG: CAP domain-containing protein [Patescibacteria group bacterium]
MNKGSVLKIFTVLFFALVAGGFIVFHIYEGSPFYFEWGKNTHQDQDSFEEGGETDDKEEPIRELSEGDTYHEEEKSKNDTVTPEPLESLDSDSDSSGLLTTEGIVRYTNEERNGEGLSSLDVNKKLKSAAKIKLNDMFSRDYFSHYDEDGGMGVSVLAEMVGYEGITVGENLAMGHFENDKDLVKAWMDSPGHRANIMKGDYMEIGIATKKGEYQGKEVWMAVQIFGRPVSDCPIPDDELEIEIEDNKAVLDVLSEETEELKTRLSEKEYSDDEEYKEDLEHYNSLVEDHNELLEETKLMVERFNTQVEIFNDCAGN